ncbi:MAG: hydrolase [Agathobacter sp.]|nr:hydrolase [Agathobacter sp.]
MNLYISDMHFGHKNCIRFDHRPFGDREEMDRVMIELWNNRVAAEDDVYILGDFAVRNSQDEAWYLKQLAGHKHLVIGNHDQRLLMNEKAMKYFESVDKFMGVRDYIDGQEVIVVLCHYPMAEWYKSKHGSWHIHGHIHGDTGLTARYMASIEHTLNAGVVINNYAPASMNELIKNNEVFRKKYLTN